MYLYQNRNDCNVSGNTTIDIELEKMISRTQLPRWPSWRDDGISEASRECSGMPGSGIGPSSGKAKSLESVAGTAKLPFTAGSMHSEPEWQVTNPLYGSFGQSEEQLPKLSQRSSNSAG